MKRAFFLVVLYAVVGTVLALVVYRVILGEPLNRPGADRTIDGLIAFLSIVMNMLLAFAAAGVAAVMIRSAHASFWLAVGISAVVAGAVGLGMMFWFPGLSWKFPVVMVAAAAVCAVVAKFAGLLAEPERGTRP